MKVICYMAISADGYIADTERKEDFLSDEHWKSFTALIQKHKAYVMGKTTYDLVQDWGNSYAEDLKSSHAILMSRTPGEGLVTSPQEALIEAEKIGASTLVIVGSTVNSLFANDGLITEIITSIEPAMIGNGVPAFASLIRPLELKLLESQTLAGHDIVQLHYTVV